MNFLEQLASEWYEYSGYFVRTNIKARKRSKGGWEAELDVVAYAPSNKELLHIETSGDSDSWIERKRRFIDKKFVFTKSDYEKIINSEISIVKRIAIAGWTRNSKSNLKWEEDVNVLLIPEFLKIIIAGLHHHHFMSEAVPENFPIIRTIQLMDKYQDLMAMKTK
jgi:hypothetical protein